MYSNEMATILQDHIYLYVKSVIRIAGSYFDYTFKKIPIESHTNIVFSYFPHNNNDELSQLFNNHEGKINYLQLIVS